MSLVATHIDVRENRSGQLRAFIAGTRVRVQDIVAMSELGGDTPDQIVIALPHLTLAQVHAALSYYFDHRDEVRQGMREDDDFARQFRLAHPGPLSMRRANGDTTGDAVPPR